MHILQIPYLKEFLIVALAHFLAVVSPGPDFALTSRNSLVYDRRAGIFTAIGLGLGILVHVTYSLIGIGLIIAKSILLFSMIKFIGAGYLIWIGWKALKSRPMKEGQASLSHSCESLSGYRALRMGFLTNVTNPKATLFFLALFTQVVHRDTPIVVQSFYGIEMSLATMLWFSFIASAFSHRLVKERMTAIMHHVEHVFGVVLMALGLRVALSTSK